MSKSIVCIEIVAKHRECEAKKKRTTELEKKKKDMNKLLIMIIESKFRQANVKTVKAKFIENNFVESVPLQGKDMLNMK